MRKNVKLTCIIIIVITRKSEQVSQTREYSSYIHLIVPGFQNVFHKLSL